MRMSTAQVVLSQKHNCEGFKYLNRILNASAIIIPKIWVKTVKVIQPSLPNIDWVQVEQGAKLFDKH